MRALVGRTRGVRRVNGAAALAGTERLRLQFEFNQADLSNFSCVPLRCFDVTADGKGFYLLQSDPLSPAAAATHVRLVLNWMHEVNSRLRSTR